LFDSDDIWLLPEKALCLRLNVLSCYCRHLRRRRRGEGETGGKRCLYRVERERGKDWEGRTGSAQKRRGRQKGPIVEDNREHKGTSRRVPKVILRNESMLLTGESGL